MTANPWTFTNTFREKLARGQFDMDGDTFKLALFQSTSNISATSTTHAGLTNEVAAGNGYTTGGVSIAFTLAGTTSLTMSFTTNPEIAASGGSISGIRTAVIYEVGGDVVAYCLLDNTPADITVTAGNKLVIDSDGSPNPAFTLS